MPPIINRDRCTGCGTCAMICNSHIFSHQRHENKVPEVKFPEECWHCNSCVLDCPAGAVTLRMPLPYTLLSVPSASLKEKKP